MKTSVDWPIAKKEAKIERLGKEVANYETKIKRLKGQILTITRDLEILKSARVVLSGQTTSIEAAPIAVEASLSEKTPEADEYERLYKRKYIKDTRIQVKAFIASTTLSEFTVDDIFESLGNNYKRATVLIILRELVKEGVIVGIGQGSRSKVWMKKEKVK